MKKWQTVHFSGKQKQLLRRATCLEMTLATGTIPTATQVPSLAPHAFLQQVLTEHLLWAKVLPNQETESRGNEVTGASSDPVNGRPQTQLE